MSARLGVAVIGTGNIADGYVSDLLRYPEIEVLGVADIDTDKRAQFAARHQVAAYPDNAALLADDRVQIVVNLTPHFAHYPVTRAALEAGKHVYSEKPLALTSAEAWELVDLARNRGVRLACSPFTMIGEAQQTVWRHIRAGDLGAVRVVYGEANWGRIETWHPAPIPFYDVGALFDVGVYILGLMTSFFGPATRVHSVGRLLLPDRVTTTGQPYRVTTPDWTLSLIEFGDGPLLRLTSNFYVANETTRQTGVEFHGDAGSLHLESFFMPDSTVRFARFGQPFEPIPLLRQPAGGIAWGTGVRELAQAVIEQRPHRFGGEQAAHITDILTACAASQASGQPVELTSTFPPPDPAPWAL
ncbi:MAG: Gfo/Idh/MocA family protein [Candidatus Flexifilum sp.]